jgi:hypothetical protein
MEDFLRSVFGVTQSAVKVLFAFWQRIVNWANESLLPWIKDNLAPGLRQIADDALVLIDKLKSPISRLIKKAWRELRKFLAKSIITFQTKILPDGKVQWIRHWATRMYNVVNPSEPKVTVITTEEPISFDDLPQDVREAVLRTQKNEIKVDFLAVRDKEIEEMEMVV